MIVPFPCGTLQRSEAPRLLDVTGALLKPPPSWRHVAPSYPIGTTVTTPLGEGRMPGAAEDMRPGRLPKVPCQSWGDSRTAGRGISPLGGEGRGKSTTPLPERMTRQ